MTKRRRARGTGGTDDQESERETDRNGVEFGSNCLILGVCKQKNLCLGMCKLF